MIIVITNRKLPVIPANQPEDIKVTSMGVKLADIDGGDRIHTGLLSDDAKSIKFYPRGTESACFNNISEAELEKPWVFFVHGFHQDPDENIEKAKAMQNYHGVNIVVFAWPSRPEDHTVDLDDAKKIIVKETLLGILTKSTLLTLAFDYAKGFLKDFWQNYDPAIAHAEASNIDLIAALKLVKNKLSTRHPMILLVHSMGNYLLQSTLNNIHHLPMVFNNIVLHEADVNSNGHEWAQKLINSLHGTASLYITINMYDGVLAASCARRGILGFADKERLGQTRHHYDVDDATYLDFTDGPKIEIDHEMFRRTQDQTNEYVFNVLGRIFRAEPDR
ncbi:MAG: alpha/beta hydrolase, partial [Gammaproteobacteria bacterium]|nr:alpha/beta hydrolase [Gammaproteobacteria bacterium]